MYPRPALDEPPDELSVITRVGRFGASGGVYVGRSAAGRVVLATAAREDKSIAVHLADRIGYSHNIPRSFVVQNFDLECQLEGVLYHRSNLEEKAAQGENLMPPRSVSSSKG